MDRFQRKALSAKVVLSDALRNTAPLDGGRGAPSTAGENLAAELASRASDVLGELLPPGTRCALTDFPRHENPGDAAIWLGTRRLLRALGVKLGYRCDAWGYDPGALAKSVESGPILLLGGGNFGDLYAQHQKLRDRILSDFPRRPVIQLPQSIWFEDAANLERAKRLCGRHAHFTLLVRERQSLEIARRELDLDSRLCPDLAFGLERLPPEGVPSESVLWLLREDRESRGAPESHLLKGADRLDWAEPTTDGQPARRGAWLRRRTNRWLRRGIRRGRPGVRVAARLLALGFDSRAAQRLERARRTLCRARVTVTDRLHGHILALLLGIPHVLLDNSYGKLRSVFETWTRECVLAHWADDPAAAAHLADSLAREACRPR